MIYTRNERLLSVTDLKVAYGPKVVLRNVNLKIDNLVRSGLNQGQVISLLGPSGCGKTQLLRCISGLQQPTAGSVKFDTWGSTNVGVVFQNYPLFKTRSVWSNLKLVANISNRTDDDIHKYIKDFNLVGREKAYPSRLSGGQRQRVAIIQQLLSNCYMFLMDEPFSGLDITMKKRAVEVILKVSLAHEHNTIIVVTHDIRSAVTIADTIVILGDPNKHNTYSSANPPGATVVKEIDLIERGLAWNTNIENHPNFFPTMLEIEKIFESL
jgi:ABC-type nitrate/sulfonate/bicarbonate transport system ATPase subunit